jgi:hypothetical protein
MFSDKYFRKYIFSSWTFYFMFPISALLLLRWLSFVIQKADFEPSSHFVQILLVVCINCLNQLDHIMLSCCV